MGSRLPPGCFAHTAHSRHSPLHSGSIRQSEKPRCIHCSYGDCDDGGKKARAGAFLLDFGVFTSPVHVFLCIRVLCTADADGAKVVLERYSGWLRARRILVSRSDSRISPGRLVAPISLFAALAMV